MLTVGVGSYGLASLVHLGLIALLAVGRITRQWAIVGLIITTFIWAVLGLTLALPGNVQEQVFGLAATYGVFECLRHAALLLLVGHALTRLAGSGVTVGQHRFGPKLVTAAAALALGIAILPWSGLPDAGLMALMGHIALAVIGLILIESLLKASRPDALWSTKHLLIGAGTLFAFDLFYYTDALLLRRPDDTLRAAQPVIATLAMPLILISARRLSEVRIDLPVSRGLIVGTTALLASGVYVLSVATIAFLIRGLGWAWGPTLQLIFLFGAGMVLLVLLASTSLRHGGRRFIERNLFTFAYDYRREWLRLVGSMAGGPRESEDGDLPLDQRALKAAATLLDADGGVLFMRGPGGAHQYTTCWNIALRDKAPPPPPAFLLDALSTARPALVLDGPESTARDVMNRPDMAAWLGSFRDPWVALALIAQSEVVGVAVITRPRLRRRLSWEDLDILAIFAHQLGSYLAVEQLARHVAETEHFERMSKHVTFVAHDLKNVISQLSLVLQQAKDHAHNPAFVSDTFLTIGDAVARMERLMLRVQNGAGQQRLQPVDVSALIKDKHGFGRCDRLLAWADDINVKAEPTALEALLDHVIDNAWEATAAKQVDEGDAAVALALRQDGAFAVIEVVDRGSGMTRDFIETELFKPFTSTKRAGFGIGMYQCRDFIERWHGRMEVESEPGIGTTIRMVLPLAESAGAGSTQSIDHPGERAA